LLLMERALCVYWRAFPIKVALKHELKIVKVEIDASGARR
jgi:hypothetical protein